MGRPFSLMVDQEAYAKFLAEQKQIAEIMDPFPYKAEIVPKGAGFHYAITPHFGAVEII